MNNVYTQPRILFNTPILLKLNSVSSSSLIAKHFIILSFLSVSLSLSMLYFLSNNRNLPAYPENIVQSSCVLDVLFYPCVEPMDHTLELSWMILLKIRSVLSLSRCEFHISALLMLITSGMVVECSCVRRVELRLGEDLDCLRVL